jgi:hypothetical protein
MVQPMQALRVVGDSPSPVGQALKGGETPHESRQQQYHHGHLRPRGQQQEAAGAGESGGDYSAGREEGCVRKGCRLVCTFLCTTPFLEKWS